MIENTLSSNCPVCHKDESTQRVQAIVASGTVSGTFSGPSGGLTHSGKEWGTYGGYTTLSGTQKSDLARLLAPPEQPKKPHVFSKIDYIFFFITVIFGTILIIPIPIILLGLIYQYFAEPVVGDKAIEQTKHEMRLAEWSSAKAYWSTLYYCHRDGIVFDPASNEMCQPEDATKFVLQHHPIRWNYSKKFVFRIPQQDD